MLMVDPLQLEAAVTASVDLTNLVIGPYFINILLKQTYASKSMAPGDKKKLQNLYKEKLKVCQGSDEKADGLWLSTTLEIFQEVETLFNSKLADIEAEVHLGCQAAESFGQEFF